MSEINWQQVAQQNRLTPDEFQKEIFTVACAVGAIDLDNQDAGTALKFTCSDEVGKLELLIKRVD